MQHDTILFLGEFDGEDAVHEATRRAVLDAAGAARVVLNTRWMGADSLALYPGMVSESAGVVLAPPRGRAAPAGTEPILQALRTVREQNIPFLATGDGHGLVFVEAARSLLGLEEANSSVLDAATPFPVVHALPPSDHDAEPHEIELDTDFGDTPLAALFAARNTDRTRERTDIRSGLNPDFAQRIADAGFRAVARDRHGGRPYLHWLEGHPYHVTAAYLPQLATAPGAPHPLFAGLVAACREAR